jgi:hypothetical protein
MTPGPGEPDDVVLLRGVARGGEDALAALYDRHAGFLLAKAMANLPQAKVESILRAAWPAWLDWHTTDARLAAALGIPMPAVSPLPGVPPGAPQPPPSPLCT